MSEPIPSKSKIVFNSSARFGVTPEDNSVGNQTNALLAAVIEKLTSAVASLQVAVTTLNDNKADLSQLVSLGTEENAKLEDIKAKLDSEIASLSGIVFSLQVLHTDNLAAQAKLDTLHGDNLVVEGKLDTLHGDNVVVEGKLDAITLGVTNFNTSLDDVKVLSHGVEHLRVQQEELGVLSRVFAMLGQIERQLSFITEEENV